ncbi:hypothetical protein SEA_YOSIF_36 [Streptomyces phage Yosif]|uniref:Uncharacterized protein n=1 Tax=Streptomyces phage Yosif TaxID=2201421 RepID=A0A2Z4QD54_9CAUD|nr:hypothetical protein KGG71_gp36 [Streptomyces phage Yosif]AWY07600.1 hypothetical protein SEA_YOSIF_36 [Streptomyces phage Yosif]
MLNFIEIPTQGGGWFKPKDNVDAVAILIEVKSFDRQRPTPNGPKDSVLADVSVFKTAADLAAGRPEIAKGQRIEQTVLARDLESIVGGATIVTLAQIPAKKPGAYPAWVWRPVADASVRQGVIDYATKREQEVQAAMDAVPDFD